MNKKSLNSGNYLIQIKKKYPNKKEIMMKEIHKDVIMNGKETVPTAEHWIVESIMKSEITVSAGAKLTATSVMKSKIFAEQGAETKFEVFMKSEKIEK